MPIYLKSKNEINTMHIANAIVIRVLKELSEKAKIGSSTLELDILAEGLVRAYGCKPAFKGYKGSSRYPFPATICASINDEIVHGIPSAKRILKTGDILSIDLGVEYNGFFGDAAITIPIGKILEEATKLLAVTKQALAVGINASIIGNRINNIGKSIQEYVEGQGFSVVRSLVGHGIGRSLHEKPQIPNYYSPIDTTKILEGMTLAIEPMVVCGNWELEQDVDGWTQRTKDRRLSAHFENSIAITKNGNIILGI